MHLTSSLYLRAKKEILSLEKFVRSKVREGRGKEREGEKDRKERRERERKGEGMEGEG